MTTTVLDILTRAMRYIGVVASGDVVGPDEAADALQQFQDVINTLPLLMDGEWCDVTLTDATTYAAKDGERIHTAGFAATITLPTTYTDDCGRTLTTRDMSRVHILDGDQAGVWVYAASLGAWAQVNALAISDNSPFGVEDDAHLAALTAAVMADEFGEQVSDTVAARATAGINSFRARFYREVHVGVDPALLIMPRMGWPNEFVGLGIGGVPTCP